MNLRPQQTRHRTIRGYWPDLESKGKVKITKYKGGFDTLRRAQPPYLILLDRIHRINGYRLYFRITCSHKHPELYPELVEGYNSGCLNTTVDLKRTCTLSLSKGTDYTSEQQATHSIQDLYPEPVEGYK